MRKGRRFIAASAVSSLLAVGFTFGVANTTAYAAGSDGRLASFCSELAGYIDRLKEPPVTRLEAFLLRIAQPIYDHYCG